jgi:type VI secretion system protein ImpE
MSEAQSEAGRLFREGKLADAVVAATLAVRKAPTDFNARILLAELLVFSGNLERADVVLDACGELDPPLMMMVSEFRQLLRGEMARRQLFRDRRVPEFLGEPTAAQRSALAALVALGAGDAAEAGRLIAQAEAERVHPAGATPAFPFDDLRDCDDLLGATFEVLTATGKYFWVAPERVMTMAFHPPKRPRDLYWRRVTTEIAGGPNGDVFMPALYPGEPVDKAPLTEALRLGRATDWVQHGDGGPIRGLGAKTFIIGETVATLLELTTLSFRPTP